MDTDPAAAGRRPRAPSPAGPERTLWVVGSSVSIEDGGYVTHLQALARERGWQLRNLSVGDQTSLMGYMRLLQHAGTLRSGDCVVWEYSLLDHLLTQDACFADQAVDARRLAWRLASRSGAGIVAVLTPPRACLGARTGIEQELAQDAAALGIAVVDLRELFAALALQPAHAHYRDDRHPSTSSPIPRACAQAVLDAAGAARACRILPRQFTCLPHWQWLDAGALAGDQAQPVRIHNALLAVDAVALAPDQACVFPLEGAVVAAGVVSTHASGGAWCGHPGCPPASVRLPAELPYRFLLRATGLACRRAVQQRIVSAPDWSYARGHWADYGQAACAQPGEVAVFGVLLAPAGAPPRRGVGARMLSRVRALLPG